MTTLDRLQRFMGSLSHTTVRLNPPASPVEIEAAEAAMRVRLPAEVRAAYRRFNGVKRDGFSQSASARPPGPALFVNSYDWVDLESMVKLWRMMEDMDADFKATGVWSGVPSRGFAPHHKVRPIPWHPKWIPIGDHGTFDKVCIDLAPGKAGVRGQIIYIGRGDPAVSAVGFDSYIQRLLDGFECGKLVLENGYFWKTPTGAVVTNLAAAGA